VHVKPPASRNDRARGTRSTTTEDELIKTRGAGLCTSWCILISNFIYPALDNYFEQQGKHRAAFSRNEIITDSCSGVVHEKYFR
jgi:hypothetical protein